ncbi:MAG: hypothetical protein GX663_01625 [Clostridiales bacterium]|nr:hypothetical protein [Clostridiales bacterium]
MLNNKIVLRIISLVIAVLLWVYVMGEVNPETKLKVNDIQVSFANTELLADDGLAAVEEDTVTVSATIKGKRSQVNEAAENGITATVDVNGCEKGKNEKELSINLPSGIALEGISQETLEFEVEDLVSEERPVEVNFIGDVGSGKLVPWSGDYDYLYVMVSGAESSVKKAEAVSGTIPTNKMHKSAQDFYVELTPVDKKGNVIYGVKPQVKGINVTAQLLTAAKVELDLIDENLSSEFEIQKISAPKTIRIIGTTDSLKSVETVKGIIDLSSITAAGKYEISIDLEELSSGVYEMDTQKDVTAVVWVVAAQ